MRLSSFDSGSVLATRLETHEEPGILNCNVRCMSAWPHVRSICSCEFQPLRSLVFRESHEAAPRPSSETPRSERRRRASLPWTAATKCCVGDRGAVPYVATYTRSTEVVTAVYRG